MSRNYYSRLIVMLFICFATSSSGIAAELTDHAILKNADEARGNTEGVAWEVSVTAKEGDRVSDITYDVHTRGFDIFASTLAPPKHKDDKILMLKGYMWFFKPGLSKPVPLSNRQRLIGNAAYGDIAATNYSEDYEAKRRPDEDVGGERCYVFDLKARTFQDTYDRIVYWVSQARLVGVKADYYTISGKKFKSSTMEYVNKVINGAQSRPFISKLTINDELMTSDTTVLRFQKPRIQPAPDSLFNLELIMK